MNPHLICWFVAMLLVIITPTALLFGVDLWRVLIVEIAEIVMLIFVGWLRK